MADEAHKGTHPEPVKPTPNLTHPPKSRRKSGLQTTTPDTPSSVSSVKAPRAKAGVSRQTAPTSRPGRPPKGEALRRTILDVAAGLFIERGTGGTSIQDIADALGLTRTAVYYYFKKKEDILQALMEDVTILAARLATNVGEREGLDPIAALHGLVRQHAALILSRPVEFRVADRNEADLTPPHREAAETARRAVFVNFSRVIQRGILTGHFRMVDHKVAALGLIGMCNWTAWWFNAEGRLTQAQVADSIADLAVHSLKRSDARRPRSQDIKESFRLVYEDLAYLEKTLLSKEPDSR
ncbi:MAG: TetR/AcrR family transcriptional regulator [Pigmentiphaga sp.]